MASGTKSKGGGIKAARASAVSSKGVPWGTVSAVVFIVLLAVGVIGYALIKVGDAEKFIVSESNQDPSDNIEGVLKMPYAPGKHVKSEQRVAYDQSAPFGGPHDQVWADCSGVVYPTPVRNENMVHALEHGTVWIAYNPDQIKDGALDTLKAKVEGQPYMMLSPYPALDRPISLQSWGHQLKLDSADDARIDQFIKSLRANQYQNPEPRGRCDTTGTGFDQLNPPPYVAEKPGADAIPMDGKGAIDQAEEEKNGQQVPVPPVVPPATGAAPPAATVPTGAPAPSS